jgi:hypothetical protein
LDARCGHDRKSPESDSSLMLIRWPSARASRHMPGHYRWLSVALGQVSLARGCVKPAPADRVTWFLRWCARTPRRTFRGGFHSLRAVLRGPVWNAILDGLFKFTQRRPFTPRGGSAPASSGWVPFYYLIIAKMNSESMQALPKSHLCSFEPQRHHRNALSGLSHFPQLLVLFGFPYSSGVLCTPDHFTTRSPHQRAGAPAGHLSRASRIKS